MISRNKSDKSKSDSKAVEKSHKLNYNYICSLIHSKDTLSHVHTVDVCRGLLECSAD